MTCDPHMDDPGLGPAAPGLLRLGWTSHFQDQLDLTRHEALRPARVVGVRKNSFALSDGRSEWLAHAAGRLRHRREGLYPVAGDWVLTADNLIIKVLERRNAISRGASGAHGKQSDRPRREQVLAANLDAVLIVCGLDRDYNPRRIERYLTLVYNCGLPPVIVLTKADLHPDPEILVNEVEGIAFGVPIHLVSALENRGLDTLAADLAPEKTVSMVGSSGAGKSTLVNRLCGKTVRATAAVSASLGKGRHTTTTRDLIILPQGGLVIDNPGLREIAFWEDEGGTASAFPEIETLADGCRFRDCRHVQEPGCRVLQALVDGELSSERLASYHKVQRELTYLERRQHMSAERLEKERWKTVATHVKAIKQGRRHVK